MHTLNEVSNKIEGLITPGEIFGDAINMAPTVAGAINPIAGIVVDAIGQMVNNIDKYKLSHLLNALAKGLNQETYMNMLYHYISNADRAFYVSNVFRKTVNSHSVKACNIMGLILADIINGNREFSQYELVLYNALDKISDIDLNIFSDIMEHYIDKGKNIDITELAGNKRTSYELTLDVLLTHRIVKEGDMIMKVGSSSKCLKVDEISNLLKKYLDGIQRW